jgi:GNAT superfamily N-acetyltransferase
MWWRLASKDWERGAGVANRDAFRGLVAQGPAPGLLGYHEGRPVGWVALAPRHDYPRLNRSPKLKPVDDEPVWAVTCFYIERTFRGTGVAGTLLRAAVEFATDSGASALEGFPVDPGEGQVANSSAFTGLLDMVRAAGFDEIVRRGGRPVMRRVLTNG